MPRRFNELCGRAPVVVWKWTVSKQFMILLRNSNVPESVLRENEVIDLIVNVTYGKGSKTTSAALFYINILKIQKKTQPGIAKAML